MGLPGRTLDFNTKHSVDGSVDVTELHFVTSCVGLPLDISHHQVGVVLRVLNDHIFRCVQRFLAIEPHYLWDGTANINYMETEAGAGSCKVLLLEREARVELGRRLQAHLATRLDLSGLVYGPAGVQALVLLLIRQDAERMVAAIRAHFVLAALDEFLAVAVPLDLWERSTNDSTSQSSRFAKLGGGILDFFLQNWSLANCRKTCKKTTVDLLILFVK